MFKCILCNNQLSRQESKGVNLYFECPRCGQYLLSEDVYEDLPNELAAQHDLGSILSYVLYKMGKRQGSPFLLTQQHINEIRQTESLPSHVEQLENLIVWMVKVQPRYGAPINITESTISAIGSIDTNSLAFIIQHAINQDLVENLTPERSLVRRVVLPCLRLTFKGWTHYDEIYQGKTNTRIAFMAMKFGDQEADLLYKNHFKPAVLSCGFELRRLDEGQSAGLIDDHLRVAIRQSRFLIADLSHHNNGAYWEAGFSEGLGKPVIYTCREDIFKAGTHFDTNHHLTVIWSPNNYGEAIVKLKNTIRATLPFEAKMED